MKSLQVFIEIKGSSLLTHGRTEYKKCPYMLLVEQKHLGSHKEFVWKSLSTNFAKGAKEEAHFFTTPVGPRPGSIWLNIEKPILQKNGVRIITH